MSRIGKQPIPVPSGVEVSITGSHISVFSMFRLPLGAFRPTDLLYVYEEQGRLKGLAISKLARSPLAPDVPTVAELGYPGFQVEPYYLMSAPAGIPEPLAALLEHELRQAVQSPDLQERFRANDTEPAGTTGADATARIKADRELWARVVKATGMTVE